MVRVLALAIAIILTITTASNGDVERAKTVTAIVEEADAEAKQTGLDSRLDGPADAYRHIIGSAAIASRYGTAFLRVLTYLSEAFDSAFEAMLGDKRIADRFAMDVHNNYLGMYLWLQYKDMGRVKSAAREIIDRGPYEGSTTAEWRDAVGADGPSDDQRADWFDAPDQRDAPNGSSSDQGEPVEQATETGEEEDNSVTDEQEDNSNTDEQENNSDTDEQEDNSDTDEQEDNSDTDEKEGDTDGKEDGRDVYDPDAPEVAPLTHVSPYSDDPEPMTFEELRQLMIESGIPAAHIDHLEAIDANLTNDNLREIFRSLGQDGAEDALLLAVLNADNPNDAHMFLAAWFRQHGGGSDEVKLLDPTIEDPPKALTLENDRLGTVQRP